MSRNVPASLKFKDLFDCVPVSRKVPASIKFSKIFDVYRCRGKFLQAFNLENSLILFRRRVKSSQALNLTKLRKDKKMLLAFSFIFYWVRRTLFRPSKITRQIKFISGVSIVYEHWPETRECITRTIELWNRWIRLSCYYNRV